MKILTSIFSITLLLLIIFAIPSVATAGDGEALFNEKCAVCHPGGGNIINPKKTLSKADREANDIKTAEDIVKTMRTPSPGMTGFPASDISDEDAGKIADYIIETFK